MTKANSVILGFLVVFVLIFYYKVGIPPHFLKADEYSNNRLNEYLSICHPAFMVNTENRVLTAEEVAAYNLEKKKFGMDEFSFITKKLDYYYREYYSTAHKGVTPPNIICD